MSDNFNFLGMPDLNDQHPDLINCAKDFIIGEPNKNLSPKKEGDGEEEAAAPEDEGEEGEEKAVNSEESEPEEIKVESKDLIELDRVNYIVHAIENDCQIAPVGAYKMTSEHQVRRNEAFKGLSSDNSLALSSYQHFRNVQTKEKKELLDQPGIAFDSNFLESIDADKPSKCWSFQHDMQVKTVLGRSLLWPGFNFYHALGTKKFGSIYIGDGMKNLELQFMTQ